MKNIKKSEVDFVILYVDCNDVAWQNKKMQYSTDTKSDVSVARYRDWNNLKFNGWR